MLHPPLQPEDVFHPKILNTTYTNLITLKGQAAMFSHPKEKPEYIS
jgi:hypothetical protein